MSPCVLPLVPSFITYITGLSFADLQNQHPAHEVRRQTIIHSLFFILGFTSIFVILGASATLLGGFLQKQMKLLRVVGGIFIIIFGIHVSGVIPINLLLGDKRVSIRQKPTGYFGSFLVGVTFAAGWTPCIGPILASILMLAATEDMVVHGVVLLFAYSMGLALPFFLTSLALHTFLVFFNRFKKQIRIFEIITGIFLVIVGSLLVFNNFSVLQRYIEILVNG